MVGLYRSRGYTVVGAIQWLGLYTVVVGKGRVNGRLTCGDFCWPKDTVQALESNIPAPVSSLNAVKSAHRPSCVIVIHLWSYQFFQNLSASFLHVGTEQPNQSRDVTQPLPENRSQEERVESDIRVGNRLFMQLQHQRQDLKDVRNELYEIDK